MTVLKSILDDLDGIPEPLRALYALGDGDNAERYVLQVEGVDGYELANVANATSGLRNARESEKKASIAAKRLDGEIKRLNAELAARDERIAEVEGKLTEGSGVDAKEIERTVRSKIESAYEARIKAAIAEKDAEIQKHTKRAETKSQQLQRVLIDERIARGANGARRYDPDLLGLKIKQHARIVEDDETGEVREEYVDANGDPIMGRNGKPATFDDLIAHIAKDAKWGTLISAEANAASGSKPSPASGRQHGNKGAVVVTREQAKDTEFYRAQQAIAKEQGREFRVIATPLESTG
jgi:hypothetical protein